MDDEDTAPIGDSRDGIEARCLRADGGRPCSAGASRGSRSTPQRLSEGALPVLALEHRVLRWQRLVLLRRHGKELDAVSATNSVPMWPATRKRVSRKQTNKDGYDALLLAVDQ